MEQTFTIIVPKRENILDDLFMLAKETGTTLKSIDIQAPTLEDVFLHLTGRKLRD